MTRITRIIAAALIALGFAASAIGVPEAHAGRSGRGAITSIGSP
jgi:hypothetical protein